MITASFHLEGSRIVSFQVEGHSGLATEGEDILCAAVTSAVRLTECAVNDVLGLEASVKVKPAEREHLSDPFDGTDALSDPADRGVS